MLSLHSSNIWSVGVSRLGYDCKTDLRSEPLPVWLVVHGHHVTVLDDAVLFREVGFGEGLSHGFC